MYDWVVLLMALVSVLFVSVLTFGLMMWVSSAQCSSRLEVGKLGGTWGPLMGCHVRMVEGHYIPYDRFRAFEETKLRRGQ